MHRELTKKVIFEKTNAKNYFEYIKDNNEYFSNIHIINHQSIYHPVTYKYSRLLILGMTFDEPVFIDSLKSYDNNNRKKLEFLEETQDDLSVKTWGILKPAILSQIYDNTSNSETPNELNIKDMFFQYIHSLSEEDDKKVLKKIDFIQQISKDSINAEFELYTVTHMRLDFELSHINVGDTACLTEKIKIYANGIIRELYFLFYESCKNKNYKLNIVSLDCSRMYTGDYQTRYSFIVGFCFSDINGTMIKYDKNEF